MIGDRIKEARENGGYTQDEFCIKIGKSKRTLANYEKNESDVSVNVALKVAKICNLDINWLLYDSYIREENIDYKSEIINTLEELNNTQLKYIYHITEAEKLKS